MKKPDPKHLKLLAENERLRETIRRQQEDIHQQWRRMNDAAVSFAYVVRKCEDETATMRNELICEVKRTPTQLAKQLETAQLEILKLKMQLGETT